MRTHGIGRGLAVYAGLIALSAYYGAAGLVLGFLPGLEVLRPRLPFDSSVLGGLALALVVAVPATLTAVLAWRQDPRAPRMSMLSGLLLVGWIAIEVPIVRLYSPLQPICLLLGLGLVVWGEVLAAWSEGAPGSTGAEAGGDGGRRDRRRDSQDA